MSETNLIPFVALGAAAITGISTVVGVIIANRSSLKQLALRLDHENEKDRSNALRNRLEELYTLIEKWAGAIVIHHTTYRRVMHGDLSYNQALDFTIESEHKFDTQRLFTIAELYFPESHESLEKLRLSETKPQIYKMISKNFIGNVELSARNMKMQLLNHCSSLTRQSMPTREIWLLMQNRYNNGFEQAVRSPTCCVLA